VVTDGTSVVAAFFGAKCASPNADPDWWHRDDPDDDGFDPEMTEYAKALCLSCPVQAACAELAMGRPDEWGVWGGMSRDERLSVVTSDSSEQHPLSPVGGSR